MCEILTIGLVAFRKTYAYVVAKLIPIQFTLKGQLVATLVRVSTYSFHFATVREMYSSSVAVRIASLAPFTRLW